MSDRERWIVYPLLFMALAVSLRDKLTQTVRAERIECRTLVFSGPGDEPLVFVLPEGGASAGGEAKSRGLLLLDGGEQRLATVGRVVQCEAVVSREVAAEQVLARKAVQSQALLVTDQRGRPLVTAGVELDPKRESNDRLGPIKTFDKEGRLLSQLGASIYCQELHVLDAQGRSRVTLGTLPLEAGQEETETVGRISVYGAQGQQAVGLSTDAVGQAGVVSTHDADGAPLAVLAANAWGGLLRITDREQTLALDLGHFGTDRLSGLVAEDASGRVAKLVDSLVRRPAPQPPDPALGPGPPEP